MATSAGLPEGLNARRRTPYILLLVVVLALGGFAQTPPGRDALRSAGVAGDPAPFTELAFIAPTTLPRDLTAGTTLTTAGFMIHNSTGRARDYRWTVSLTSPGGTAEAAAGQAHLADGAVTTVTPAIKVGCRPGPVTVTARLDGGETVSWHATCDSDDAGQQG